MDPLMEELQLIAEQWLKAYAYTVATNDVDAHLAMVSQRLQVVGISRDGFLEYREWAKRRRNDMQKRRLLRITYRNLVMGTCSRERMHFTVEETIKSTQGETYELNKEVVLNLEPDGKWRVVEEHVHNVRLLPPAKHGMPQTNPTHPATEPGESG
ncbi:MAG: hypothetical protein CVV05_18980 [Gammaproteobacteria bacterium HGW-Gammaproteobacteria-1]|nr:MAG: hypothetical protein CVV05_18980 [Gammaproteobacteria bacterium HGW-Gammaproteobacteria-1]